MGFLLLAALAGAIGVWVGIPYLERRWTFNPVDYRTAAQWPVPESATEVTFPTSDGVRLTGWFFSAKPPGNGITVLEFAGLAGYLPIYLPATLDLQERGFNALLFSYRGFGKGEGRSLGETTLNIDAAAAMRYLTAERGIDPQSIALLGLSFGTAIAADVAVSFPCHAVALGSSFASAKRQAKYSRPWLPDFLLDYLSSPFDTVGKIGRANCPVMVIHGHDDRTVPLEQAQAVYDAARPPKRLLVVPGGTHGHIPPDNLRHTYDELQSFFISRR